MFTNPLTDNFVPFRRRLGIFVCGADECWHATIGRLLSPNPWYDLLVFESVLRARDRRRWMDGELIETDAGRVDDSDESSYEDKKKVEIVELISRR